ncbi:hypothetical protein MAR_006104 [Mya arenaria]|uniref:Uncharacterized protein n=1 Tax=Mya arenaria TaxID=6604 RepID=A0ABY7D8M6_MYAAR|nr:hypothetical protein MAR_006104 [Mya arenaria]
MQLPTRKLLRCSFVMEYPLKIAM